MTVTGTVASSNAPPDKPDDVDVTREVDTRRTPSTWNRRRLPSLVRAPGGDGAGAGPGPAGVHLDAPNGVNGVDAGGTSTETEAGAGTGADGAATGPAGSVPRGRERRRATRARRGVDGARSTGRRGTRDGPRRCAVGVGGRVVSVGDDRCVRNNTVAASARR